VSSPLPAVAGPAAASQHTDAIGQNLRMSGRVEPERAAKQGRRTLSPCRSGSSRDRHIACNLPWPEP
jgi:hypothetical protein